MTPRTMIPHTMVPRKTLAEHVQDLPADLYYIIFDYTLTLDGHMGIQHYAMITKKWKPPVQLQINRATRAKVAEKFYRDSFFTIRSGHYVDLLSLFFGRLSEEHASMITRVGRANLHAVPEQKQADYIRMCIWRGRNPQIRREMWDMLEETERVREKARRDKFW